jgi:hypothetical protein
LPKKYCKATLIATSTAVDPLSEEFFVGFWKSPSASHFNLLCVKPPNKTCSNVVLVNGIGDKCIRMPD